MDNSVIYDRYDPITGRKYRKTNGKREYEPCKIVNSEIVPLINSRKHKE